MISIGDWVCGVTEDGWTYPGRVTCVNSHFIIFEIPDFDGTKYETHRTVGEIRKAGIQDFDRAILDASKFALGVEAFVSHMYDVQQTLAQ